MEGNKQKKKVVILHTFPPSPNVYNISPFAIKVESYLRINNISYEIVYTSKFGPKGKIPYIHLVDEDDDGRTVVEVIPDSNVIIARLGEAFVESNTVDSSNNNKLIPQEAAISHAITRMLEEHTTQIGFYHRYGLHLAEFAEKVDLYNRVFHADTSAKMKFILNVFQTMSKLGLIKNKKFPKRMENRGLLSHTKEELWKFSNDDLKAISTILGDNKKKEGKAFFFGKDDATLLDCVVFGHISQFLYLPLEEFPQRDFLEKECPNILFFMETFKNRYWSDWEEKCKRQPNERLTAKKKKRNVSRSLLMTTTAVGIGFLAYFMMKGKE